MHWGQNHVFMAFSISDCMHMWLYTHAHSCTDKWMATHAWTRERVKETVREKIKASLLFFFLKLALIISIQQSKEIFIGLLMEVKISDSGVYVCAGLRCLSLDGQRHPINPLLGVNPVISQPPAFAITLPSAHHCAWQLRKANLNGLLVRKELMASIKKHLEIQWILRLHLVTPHLSPSVVHWARIGTTGPFIWMMENCSGRVGGVSLLEEVCHWSGLWDFQIKHHTQSCSLCLKIADQTEGLHHACSPACCHACRMLSQWFTAIEQYSSSFSVVVA